MRGKTSFLISSAVFGFSSLAHGQGMIDIAFGNGNSTPSGAAYYGASGDQWNVFNADNTANALSGAMALSDTTGVGTATTVNFLSQGGVQSAATGTQPNPAFSDYYMFNNEYGSLAAFISGLIPNSSYQLAIYVASDDGGGNSRALDGIVTGGAGMITFAATGDPMSTWSINDNVVLVNTTADFQGNIEIQEYDDASNYTGEVDMNGIQISGQFNAVPEPAPFLALGLGALGLVIRRRRKV